MGFGIANKARRWLFEDAEEGDVIDSRQSQVILEEIEQAKLDWISAKSYFDNATDPDLVDHAIYVIEASERKYMYLLKQSKSMGIVQQDLLSATDSWTVD